MDSYLQGLIKRMSDRSYRPGERKIDDSFESKKTVAAAAYEEVRQLSNIEFVPQLFDFVKSSGDNAERGKAYFIAGCIGKNTNDKEMSMIFIEHLKHEKDVEILKTILRALANLFKPITTDLTPIKKLTTHRNFLVRADAYQALTNTEHSVEEYLAERLQGETNNADIQYLLTALQYVGTIKSLSVIEPHLKSRNSMVKEDANTSYALILIRDGHPDDVIAKKLKCPESGIQILRSRLHLLTRPG